MRNTEGRRAKGVRERLGINSVEVCCHNVIAGLDMASQVKPSQF